MKINDFWSKLDTIVANHEIIIDRPAGSCHPRFSDMVYPFDYGYLKGTSAGDGNEIDVCLGSLERKQIVAIICTVDTKKLDTETKLLIDCTGEEINQIETFFNSSQFMSGIIIRRE